MGTKIIKSVSAPLKAPIEALKTGMKSAIKPAEPTQTAQIFIGAILSPPVAYGYNKLMNWVFSKIPSEYQNTIIFKIVKLAFPLLPVYFVRKSRMPFGNLINGTLLGVFVMNIIYEIYSLFKGKTGNTNPSTNISAKDLIPVHNGLADF